MKMLRLLAIVIIGFTTCFAAESLAGTPKLCGDVNTIQPAPLSQSPHQFKTDSDSREVYLLPSPDGRYVAVLRHGACGSTFVGIWDKINHRAYGDGTVSFMYGTAGVCWDAKKPAVYFFYSSEGGYPDDEAGIYKWEFEKSPDEPQQLDSSAIVKQHFKRDSIYATLMAISKDSQNLLLDIEFAYNGGEIGYDSHLDIKKFYIFNIADKKFSPCEKCDIKNWERKTGGR